MDEKIKINTKINAPIQKVWDYYNNPEHVTKWNAATEDWHSPKAVNDLKVGGSFNYRMEARDGSEGFDFTGIYDKIDINKFIQYTMTDGRVVKIQFNGDESSTAIEIEFDAETFNTIEVQKDGWQSILNNFKNYVENN